MTMVPAYCYNPANIPQVKAIFKDAPVGTCRCGDCAQTGVYHGGGTVNGVPVRGGTCFRCGGKGWQTPKDQKRNDYYDMHIRYRNISAY